MNRKQLFNVLKIVVSLTLLLYIFSTIDFKIFVATVSRANPWWLLVALGMMMLGVVIRAFRWKILLDAIGVVVPVGELTAIYFIGFLFNNLLPSGLGGDAIRMMELNRHTEHGSDAVTSVVVDRFLGLLALQAIALIALAFSWTIIPTIVAYFTIFIFTAMITAGLLLINRPLYLNLQAKIPLFRRITEIKTLNKLFESFQQYPLPALGKSFLVSILFNISLITMNVFIGWAVGATASVAHYAIFVPITSLVLVIPISFAGLGIREEGYRQLFGQVGVPGEVAVAMSLLVYIFGNICTGLIGGVIYFLRGARGMVSEQS